MLTIDSRLKQPVILLILWWADVSCSLFFIDINTPSKKRKKKKLNVLTLELTTFYNEITQKTKTECENK